MPPFKVVCKKCGNIAAGNDSNAPIGAATAIHGSCNLCTPDSIMTTCLYLDAQGDRVGQDAANPRKIKGALKV